MSELVRMARQFESMNVPPDKVAAFLAEGWTEIERIPMTGDAPKAKAAKPKGKSTGKPEDVEPVEPEPKGKSTGKPEDVEPVEPEPKGKVEDE